MFLSTPQLVYLEEVRHFGHATEFHCPLGEIRLPFAGNEETTEQFGLSVSAILPRSELAVLLRSHCVHTLPVASLQIAEVPFGSGRRVVGGSAMLWNSWHKKELEEHGGPLVLLGPSAPKTSIVKCLPHLTFMGLGIRRRRMRGGERELWGREDRKEEFLQDKGCPDTAVVLLQRHFLLDQLTAGVCLCLCGW